MYSLRDVDSWNQGDSYDRYMGRWSLLLADEFLDWLDAPPGARWLDVGCGTGALSSAIAATRQPSRLSAIDQSEDFVAAAASSLGDAAHVRVGDATAIPFADGSFDVTVSGLVLNFVPAVAAATSEMARVTRAGGLVGAYVWDYAGGMEMIGRFWEAACRLDPDAAVLDEARRFTGKGLDWLHDALSSASLGSIEARTLQAATRFEDFDDYWAPFLGGTGPAPAYVASLSADARDRLAATLHEELGDGPIVLGARAHAARGTVGDG